MKCHIRAEGSSGSLLRLCAFIIQLGMPLLCVVGASGGAACTRKAEPPNGDEA
jgi:hypothetical protein